MKIISLISLVWSVSFGFYQVPYCFYLFQQGVEDHTIGEFPVAEVVRKSSQSVKLHDVNDHMLNVLGGIYY